MLNIAAGEGRLRPPSIPLENLRSGSVRGSGVLPPPADHRRSRPSVSRVSLRRDRRRRGRRCHRSGAGPPGLRDGLRPSLPPGSSRRADTDTRKPQGSKGSGASLARPPCSTRSRLAALRCRGSSQPCRDDVAPQDQRTPTRWSTGCSSRRLIAEDCP